MESFFSLGMLIHLITAITINMLPQKLCCPLRLGNTIKILKQRILIFRSDKGHLYSGILLSRNPEYHKACRRLS